MYVDIIIDRITPCLIRFNDGEIVKTSIKAFEPTVKDTKCWLFDWTKPLKEGYNVYALIAEGDHRIQGLLSIKDDAQNCAIEVGTVETAPHNFGSIGEYQGIGAHLFAFAGKKGIEKGYDCIYFDAKTDLIEYYTEMLGAQQLGNSQRMILEGNALEKLVKYYYGDGTDEKK